MCNWLKRIFQPKAPLYPSELPFLPLDKVIEELEFDIEIHKAYAGLVTQDPRKYPPETYGDYEWQTRWIKVYESALYYIRGSR